MSHRNLEFLNRRRIVYRRGPITDTPSESYSWGDFYETGTYECYELFRSKAKITSYRSMKWHLLVLWYLNPQLTYDEITDLARFIWDKDNGFTTIKLSDASIVNLVDEVFEKDLEEKASMLNSQKMELEELHLEQQSIFEEKQKEFDTVTEEGVDTIWGKYKQRISEQVLKKLGDTERNWKTV